MTILILPDELILKLLSYLKYDQVLICKLLCKRLYKLINDYCKLKQLAISSDNYYAYPCKWFYSDLNIIDCQFQIVNSKFNPIQLKLNQLFQNLRQLFILQKIVDTEFLNELTNLTNLAIRSCRFKSDKKSLNLINLKIFSIEESELVSVVKLNLPNLKYLKLNLFNYYNNKLIFENSKDVELLETTRYFDLIKNFPNLKYLFCERLVKLNLDPLLKYNKKLIEIYFDSDLETYYLLKKEQLNLKKLQIYYLCTNLIDCDLTNYNELNNFGIHIDESTIKFYVHNYNRLANVLPFVKFINYNCIENNFKIIPNNLFKKFINCYQLEITESIKDVYQFKNSLKDLGYINRLFINTSQLDEYFFNNELIKLSIKCLEIKNNKNYNSKFLLKLNSLEALFIDRNLSIELIKQLYAKFKIKYLSFYHQESSLFLAEISTNDKNQFILNIFPYKKSFNNLDLLLNYLDTENYKTDFIRDLNYEERMMHTLFFKKKDSSSSF